MSKGVGLIAKLACDHIKGSQCNMKDKKGNGHVSVNLVIFSSI